MKGISWKHSHLRELDYWRKRIFISLLEYKRKPVIPFAQRMEIVRNIKRVDRVVTQNQKDPTETLKGVQSDIVTHSDDWGESFLGSEYMRSIGKEAKTFKYHSEVRSTTEVIEAIKNRDDL